MDESKLTELFSQADANVPNSSLGFSLPKSLLLRWQSAGSDFHQSIPLASEADADSLVIWWLQDWGGFTEIDSITAAFILDLGPYLTIAGNRTSEANRLPYDWLVQLFNSARDFSGTPFKVFLQPSLILRRDQQDEFHSWIVTIQRIVEKRPMFGKLLFKRIAALMTAVNFIGPEEGVVPSLTLFSTIWEGRADLRAKFDFNNLDGFHRYIDWFLRYGISEYWLALHVLVFWLQPQSISEEEDFLGEGILHPAIAQSVVGLKSELDFVFYSEERIVQKNILTWWLTATRFLFPRDQMFETPVSIVRRLRELWFHANFGCTSEIGLSEVPRHLCRLYETTLALQKRFSLKDSRGRGRFLNWWRTKGYYEYPFYRQLHDEFMFAPALAVQQDLDVPVTNYWIHRVCQAQGTSRFLAFSTAMGRLDEYDGFIDSVKKGDSELNLSSADKTGAALDIKAALCIAARAVASNELLPRNDDDALNWWLKEQRRRIHRSGLNFSEMKPFQLAPQNDVAVAPTNIDVEIVGFPRAESGQGEDARTIFESLNRTGTLEISLFHTKRTLPTPNRAGFGFEKVISPILRDAKVRIFAFSAFDALAEEQFEGTKIFSSAYLIGYWPWELSRWPRAVPLPHEIVDEIWASTRFALNSQIEVTSKPVLLMPLPVTVDVSTLPGRDAIPQISADVFTFVFVFDGLSYFERKNPLGVIRAFQLAFPKGGSNDVALVIKTMNADQHPILHALKMFAEDDPRISLICETWERPKVLQLIASADALVSLHRSEGFGRIMAEAMLLKTPVIASAYSGNSDFCTEETAFLVGGCLKPLTNGQYIHWNNQEWFDPSIQEAAAHMQLLYKNPKAGDSKVKAAYQAIVQNYSLEACGCRYAKRIAEIL